MCGYGNAHITGLKGCWPVSTAPTYPPIPPPQLKAPATKPPHSREQARPSWQQRKAVGCTDLQRRAGSGLQRPAHHPGPQPAAGDHAARLAVRAQVVQGEGIALCRQAGRGHGRQVGRGTQCSWSPASVERPPDLSPCNVAGQLATCRGGSGSSSGGDGNRRMQKTRCWAGAGVGGSPAGVSQNSCSRRASSGGGDVPPLPLPAGNASGQRQSGPSRCRCSPCASIIWPLHMGQGVQHDRERLRERLGGGGRG